MILTDNFSLAELTVSQTATRKGIDNTPSQAVITNLKALAQNILQPVRDHFDAPVIVTSGYRSKALNRAIGGSSTSQHCYGEAADFTVVGVSNREVVEWIRDNLDFGQVIYEFGERGWVHCSYGRANKNQVLSAARNSYGRTLYTSGLPA